MSTDSASWISVSPSASSPATASAIATRWSPSDRTCAPCSVVGPSIVQPSSLAVMFAPIAASPSAMAAMRSDSLTRSSAAPEMWLRPASWVAATARIGSSSIISAAVSPETSSGSFEKAAWTSRSATGSPALMRWRDLWMSKPWCLRRSRNAVRVGFTPTPGRTTVDPRPRPAPAPPQACRAPPEARGAEVARDLDVERLEHGRLADLDASLVCCDVGAHGPEHQLGVVAGRHRLDDRGRAFGKQARDQNRRLDLCARHRHLVLDAAQRHAAAHAKRWPLGVRAHLEQGLHHAVHGPPGQRLVAGELAREVLGREDPGEQAHRRARVATVQRALGLAHAIQPKTADGGLFDHRPQRAKAVRSRLDVGAAGQAVHAAPSVRQRAKDQGAVRDRLVARQGNLALEPLSFANSGDHVDFVSGDQRSRTDFASSKSSTSRGSSSWRWRRNRASVALMASSCSIRLSRLVREIPA